MRVSKYNRGNLKYEIICLALVLAGVAMGTLCFLADVDFHFFYEIFCCENQKEVLLSWEVFVKFLVFGSIILLALFLCGLSAVFQPVIVMNSVLIGIIYGYSISEIYSSQLTNGVVFSVATIIVPSIVLFFVIIIGWRESFYMSVNIAGAIFSEKNFIGFKDAVKIYVVKFLVLEAIVAVGAFLRCVIYSLF